MKMTQASAWVDSVIDGSRPVAIGQAMHHRLWPGWYVDWEGLEEHLFWLIERGRATGEVAGRPTEVGPGDVLWVPPGTPFNFTLVDPNQPITLYRLRLWCDGSPIRRAVHRPDAWGQAGLFAAAIAEAERGDAWSAARRRALVGALMAACLRPRPRRADTRALSGSQRAAIHAAVDGDPAHRWTAGELAEVVGLTPDYFTRLFRASFGMPPRAWVVDQRMRYAAVWLRETDEPVGEVALAMGYDDLFLFSRQFKRVMGVSPTAHRRQPQG